ncbi:unnamed protein product [Gongylonema pulchrum]|uniref:LRRCT domain-containing protein n=1 Tax=Gongylonema pulchrum TaxID=637853 RepID=A0A183EF97_9BILA|nr:unnamed protein product [Gongylonema pulchrum]
MMAIKKMKNNDNVHGRALSGLPLNRFYLNRNRLLHLPKRLLDDLNVEQVVVVDFSDNLWQCVCGEEWLADWLSSIGDRNVADGNMGCIRTRACTPESTGKQKRHLWITIIASVLALVSVLILIAIALLYVEDVRRMDKLSNPLRRVPSDLLQLIPSGDSSVSLPCENGIEPLLGIGVPKEIAVTSGQLRLSTCIKSPLIVQNSKSSNNGDGDNITISDNSNNTTGGNEKKRVRFNDA